MGLVFSNSNFFINKISHANKWSAKKIPSCINLALWPIGSTVLGVEKVGRLENALKEDGKEQLKNVDLTGEAQQSHFLN